jgi:hypothetical protein
VAITRRRGDTEGVVVSTEFGWMDLSRQLTHPPSRRSIAHLHPGVAGLHFAYPPTCTRRTIFAPTSAPGSPGGGTCSTYLLLKTAERHCLVLVPILAAARDTIAYDLAAYLKRPIFPSRTPDRSCGRVAWASVGQPARYPRMAFQSFKACSCDCIVGSE